MAPSLYTVTHPPAADAAVGVALSKVCLISALTCPLWPNVSLMKKLLDWWCGERDEGAFSWPHLRHPIHHRQAYGGGFTTRAFLVILLDRSLFYGSLSVGSRAGSIACRASGCSMNTPLIVTVHSDLWDQRQDDTVWEGKLHWGYAGLLSTVT